MNDKNLVDFSTIFNSDYLTISFSVATWFAISILVALIIFFIIKYRHIVNYHKVKLKKIVLNLPGGKIEFDVERNHSNLEIANKILIELITRKAAIPIEEDKDVITEIYDSWYAIFCTTRDEIKLIRGELLTRKKSESLVEMATDVLNKGLRPHLTEYQARFRRWFSMEIEKESNRNLSPQEVQTKFPDYDDLILSIKKVNMLLTQYATELKNFIYT